LPVNRGFFAYWKLWLDQRILKEYMKNRNKNMRFETRFGTETRFEVGPFAAVPFRGTVENDLELLKARLLRQLLAPVAEPGLNTVLRRAANEAASLAWSTPFPLLVFPTLLEEKAVIAERQWNRQGEIRQRSHEMMAEAVS
jgi:hypothetical protein